MIVTSYYTNDAFYLGAGRALIVNCTHLGLACDIRSVDHVGRKAATNYKPLFILQMIKKYRQPVWWFDVDSLLLAKPPEIPADCWMAVHHQPIKVKFPVRSNAIYFSGDDRAVAFLRLWIKQCEECKHFPSITDHTPMIDVWKKTDTSQVAKMNFNAWHCGNGFKDIPHPIHG